LKSYPATSKTQQVICIGSSPPIKKFAKDKEIPILTDLLDFGSVSSQIATANFTILYADGNFPPFLIYEIIRARSVPVLIGGPFLPAFANTHVNYTKISIRADNLETVLARIQRFNTTGIRAELEKSARFLTWPTDGRAAAENAGGVLFDLLNTRHRVMRPIMRRTFIGSDQYIP
jgi:hypothetical protein